MSRTGRLQRGISLIEALVAIVVMSFGTLAVLGVQASLRANGDISKQRAEAVRIGQQTIERWRGFADLSGTAADRLHFNDLADGTDAIDGTNATYNVTLTVPPSGGDPRYRTVVVDVGWADRSGQAQAIRLSSAIGGADPAFAGTLAVPAGGSAIRNPAGRHPDVPPEAVNQEGGTSRFAPPGAGTGVGWVFDNVTGFITQTCVGDTCTPLSARLLSGYVVFSTGSNPNPEVPASPRINGVGVYVDQTAPDTHVGTVQCYEDTAATRYLIYYCAVPVGNLAAWSGRSLLSGLDLAKKINDDDEDEYRVCRYTPYRAHLTVPTQMSNQEHPRDYVSVATSLVNQNFLVIRAGDDDDPYDCPADDTSTPLVNGNTWHHQPAT